MQISLRFLLSKSVCTFALNKYIDVYGDTKQNISDVMRTVCDIEREDWLDDLFYFVCEEPSNTITAEEVMQELQIIARNHMGYSVEKYPISYDVEGIKEETDVGYVPIWWYTNSLYASKDIHSDLIDWVEEELKKEGNV